MADETGDGDGTVDGGEPSPEVGPTDENARLLGLPIVAWWVIAGIVALVGVAAVAYSAGSGSGEEADSGSGEEADAPASTSSTVDPLTQDEGAYNVCTQFVSDRLRAPATAIFPPYDEDNDDINVHEAPEETYTIEGVVDSENGFGALIRSTWTCEVVHEEGVNFRGTVVVTDGG